MFLLVNNGKHPIGLCFYAFAVTAIALRFVYATVVPVRRMLSCRCINICADVVNGIGRTDFLLFFKGPLFIFWPVLGGFVLPICPP